MAGIDIASVEIERLTTRSFPGWSVSVLKEISGGQSGAAVLLVDIAICVFR